MSGSTSANAIRACYATCGTELVCSTELAYAATKVYCYATCGTELGYGGTRCGVLSLGMTLPELIAEGEGKGLSKLVFPTLLPYA
eukprot:588845-Rhodomonas_salina.3